MTNNTITIPQNISQPFKTVITKTATKEKNPFDRMSCREKEKIVMYIMATI